MPGFFGTISDRFPAGNIAHKASLIHSSKQWGTFNLEQHTLDKFSSDKPFFENGKYLLLLEGVVLNRKQLQEGYTSDSFAAAIIRMYEKHGESFFNHFRGSFSGVFVDKKKEIYLVYTNHIGDKQVFYTGTPDHFIFGSEPGWVFDYCKKHNLPLSLDEEAAYMLLTYGFFVENQSLAREVRKLTAGHYLRIKNGKFEEIQYHRFSNEPDHSKTEAEWIEGIDRYFRQAVQRQFDKDLEYGYKHITTLSGGLDSRMTVWVAHQMGYTEQLNTTFSQSNYLDETIAKQIASDLKHAWIFKALDHGNFLKNVDEATLLTCGGGNYHGLAHGKSLYDLVDFERHGIMHTGQIGDAIIGTFYDKPEIITKISIGDGSYNQKLISRLKDYVLTYDYANQEIFKLHARAFNGANQGLLVFQEKTESCSPFLDVDFLEYCYSIPVELRYKHKIYFNWILEKYPAAAYYIWEKTRSPLKKQEEIKKINILGKKIEKKRIFHWLLGAIKRRLPYRKLRPALNPLNTTAHMNPLDFWYNTNAGLKHFLDAYFKEYLNLISDEKLTNDCSQLYVDGDTSEKLQVISLLSAIKHLESGKNPILENKGER